MITLGKKGSLPAYRRANAFILKPTLVPKLFGNLAKRYAERPGGYTRIHKFGNRPGDNAPHAILELVDNPRDIRFEMTARSVGWELLGKKVGSSSVGDGDRDVKGLINSGVRGVHDVVQEEKEKKIGCARWGGELRPKTRWNLQKVLRYRKVSAVKELGTKAEEHIVSFV